mgnify:CR=1 FL=1
MTEPIEGYCDHCGKWGRVTYDVDPLLYDLYGECEYSYWCDECYNERALEI